MEYTLLDSGNGQKLEKFGKIHLIRPCPYAVWSPKLDIAHWNNAHARFSRDNGNIWEVFKKLPEEWTITLQNLRFKLKRTDFGHLGIFPEHAFLWPWMISKLSTTKEQRVLNLFAYSGGATLALAKAGAFVTHLDASKGMVSWAQENAELNHLRDQGIRWIVDDVKKYLKRAQRRGERYDGIIVDPPSFGRGKSKEVFKIERDLKLLLQDCKQLLSDDPAFLLFTCHTPGYTPIVMQQLMKDNFSSNIESGEMIIEGPLSLPQGSYARWTP